MQNNYNIVAGSEAEKYRIIDMIRAAGATVTGVSGYGSGYYIQLSADCLTVAKLNRALKEGRESA